MYWHYELLLTIRVLYSALLGGMIGWEHENNDWDAGLRTYMAVAVGRVRLVLFSSRPWATQPELRRK